MSNPDRNIKGSNSRLVLASMLVLCFAAAFLLYSFIQAPDTGAVSSSGEKNIEDRELTAVEQKSKNSSVVSGEGDNPLSSPRDPFSPDPIAVIPDVKEVEDLAPDDDPDIATEPADRPDAEVEEKELPEQFETYVVQRCDSLYSISRELGVPMHVIAEDNDIEDMDKIKAGMELRIRTSEQIDPEKLETPYYK